MITRFPVVPPGVIPPCIFCGGKLEDVNPSGYPDGKWVGECKCGMNTYYDEARKETIDEANEWGLNHPKAHYREMNE